MELYCSTGAFIGMVNGRNHHLLLDYGERLNCDGFELLMMDTWRPKAAEILRDLRPSGLRFPVIHADKDTGVYISSKPDRDFREGIELWKENMELGAALSSRKAVAHIWDRPDSDREPERILERVLVLREIAASYGIDMLIENCVCAYGSPIAHFVDFARKAPGLGMIIDVRPAQFHQELGRLYAARQLWRDNIRHLHVSDYHGGYKEFSHLRPILGPGEGDINSPRFFDFIREIGYDGSVTLESPAMLPDRVDVEKLNSYLDYLRKGFIKA